ncbi:MAG: hypothetical protein HGB19_10495 [Chlorobiales bacterium]|nr:hypothetical protein [Chlorobiales bacterium]
MASTSETGHAKTVATYNPLKAALKQPAQPPEAYQCKHSLTRRKDRQNRL